MAEDKSMKQEQIEKRGASTDLAAAAISGTTGGVAGALATQAMGKLTGTHKPKDEPKK